jgi:predicted DNA-binding antitoxin AbrB/MazE fold protein
MLEADAVYENGVLKLEHPLPLADRQRVHVTIQTKTSRARQSSGLIPWKGTAEELERIAIDPEFGIEETP